MDLRAFVAVDVDAAAHERLVRAMDALRPRLHGLKWVRPEGLHLTLRFLGWTTEAVLHRLTPRLVAAAARCPPGESRLTGYGMFPERGSPRVLWVGMDFVRPLLALQEECEEAAVACGFEAETRPFSPHLTLGRWRDRVSRPTLPEEELGATRLERLVLYRSELRRDGAVYTPLATFPLGG